MNTFETVLGVVKRAVRAAIWKHAIVPYLQKARYSLVLPSGHLAEHYSLYDAYLQSQQRLYHFRDQDERLKDLRSEFAFISGLDFIDHGVRP